MISRAPRSTLFPYTTLFDLIWGVTLKVIPSSMPFGAGIGAYPQAYTPFDTLSGLERVEQRSEEHTSELQSRQYLVCRLLLEKKNHIVSANLCMERALPATVP